MKFDYGEGQEVEGIQLDKVHEDLLEVLRRHGLDNLLTTDANEVVEHWMNELLFLGGHQTVEEAQSLC